MENIQTKKYTIDEYFEVLQESESRIEFIKGDLRVLDDYASETHELVVINLATILNICLDDKEDCRVYGSHRLIHIPECQKFYFPDLIVICGEPERYKRSNNIVANLNPTIIVEVLSESTEKNDRDEKWHCYQKIKSLKQYLLVSQDRIRIESFQRINDLNEWIYTDVADTEKKILVGECEVQLKDIYKKTDLLKS